MSKNKWWKFFLQEKEKKLTRTQWFLTGVPDTWHKCTAKMFEIGEKKKIIN